MGKMLELKSVLRRHAALDSLVGLLDWDHQVNLPPHSHELRTEQLAVTTEIAHREKTSDSYRRILDDVGEDYDSLSEEDRLIFDHARKHFEKSKEIPNEFAARKAEKQAQAYQKWVEAREADDFDSFAPFLEEQIELCKEEAGYVGSHSDAYAYMIDQFDEGMDPETIDRLFGPMGEALQDLLSRCTCEEEGVFFSGLKFPAEKQEVFLREVITKMGFDFNHGRLDRSVHPFCAGTGQDIRMTTRFFEDNPLDSLYSSIHETGHALYEQGLPPEDWGNRLGTHAGMAVHESQSRLWENQVARSVEFWEFWESRYRECFAEQLNGISSKDWLNSVMIIKPIPIRVDSDEVTYNLHILIRYELEKRLFAGDLMVKDLPAAWNALYERLLGICPGSDAEGVLQDVHWSSGAFGYFPSYAVGNIISAQLWESLESSVQNVKDQVRSGEYASILKWLRERIHSVGARYSAKDLVKEVTGKDLSEQPLVKYLDGKYGKG